MSRVAKQPIILPSGVDVNIAGQSITVKGPKGELCYPVHPLVEIKKLKQEVEETSGKASEYLQCAPRNDTIEAKALAGTNRAIVNNIVCGVHTGFEKQLELRGVGYRAKAQGNTLNLVLGFSHPVTYTLPKGITAEVPSNTIVVIKGIDKQQVGQVAAEIRSLRPPEPYKGKGIRYVGETVIRKEVKKK